MPDEVYFNALTAMFAVMGAIAGGTGTEFINRYWRGRKERDEKKRELLKRYLYGFQESAESLWYRLYNLSYRGGKDVMDNDYLLTSTLYSIGSVLAYHRIMRLEGVYADLNFLGTDYMKFRQSVERFGKCLDNVGYSINSNLFRYDRISLAEALLSRDEGQNMYRIITYLEFKEKWFSEEGQKRKTLATALNFVKALTERENIESQLNEIMENLHTTAVTLAKETRIDTTIGKNENYTVK